jgi:hypothetical protein
MSRPKALRRALATLVVTVSAAGSGCGESIAAEAGAQTPGTNADTTPPSVISTVPPSGAPGGATNAAISATFDDQLRCTTLTNTTFTLVRTSDGAPVPGTVTCAGATATLSPSFPLQAVTSFTARLSVAVRDDAGNSLPAPFQWQFTSGGVETTPPTLASFSPASNATQVGLRPIIQATFSEAIDCATVRTDPDPSPTFYVNHDPTVPIAATLTCAGSTATITPVSALAPGTAYTVGLSGAIRDLSGSAFAGFGWSFTTGDGTAHGTLTFTPLPGFTAPAAPLLTIVPNQLVTVQTNVNCALVSLGDLGSCTVVMWTELQPGPTGVDKVVTLWFEPNTGERSQLQYLYQPHDDFSWGWVARATVLNTLPGVTVDRAARIVTIQDTLLGVTTRPAPVSNPGAVTASGVLTYP